MYRQIFKKIGYLENCADKFSEENFIKGTDKFIKKYKNKKMYRQIFLTTKKLKVLLRNFANS